MNRIDERFEKLRKENKKALITFLTVGDPNMEVSERAIYAMQEEGADLIELGVPFSDPSADGPTIQRADERALANGTDIFKVFDLVEKIRDKVEVPMVFLLYYNVIIQYGPEEFFARCKSAGIDGLIIPDLPYEESGEIKEYTEKYGVYQINLVSPTSRERIKNIAADAKGFLYCVSSLGVTGEKSSFNTDFDEFVGIIKKHANVPACVGFGISNGEQVRALSQYFDGAIVGSAVVKAIATGESADERISNLRAKIKDLKSGLE
jgi:tryptophan synthase alpha chain